MFSLKRGIPEWQEAVVSSLSQCLQKMAGDALSLFSRQWHFEGSGRLLHLLKFKAGYEPGRTTLLPRRTDCWGISTAEALIPISPISNPWEARLAPAAAPANARHVQNRLFLEEGGDTGWEHQQLLCLHPCRCLERTGPARWISPGSHTTFVSPSFSCARSRSIMALFQVNEIQLAVLFREAIGRSDKDLASSLGTKIMWWADPS